MVRFSDANAGTPVLEKLLASEAIALDRVSHDKGAYIIRFGNTGEEAVRFLNKILSGGAPIAECSLKNDTIEDIFLKVGAKEVA